MEIKIRDYQTADCPAILAIINDAILHSTALYDYNERTLAAQVIIFEEKLQKGFPVIVAEMNNEVLGFGYYSEFRFREAYKFTVEHSVYANKNAIGKGIGKLLLTELIQLAKAQTSVLNEVMGEIIEKNPPATVKGKMVSIKYITQLPTKTPAFAFFANHPKYIQENYKRFLENKLRENFDLCGVPISLFFREK